MGVMELIPYIGPLLAGIPAVLLGLTGGWNRALWTLAVLVGCNGWRAAFFPADALWRRQAFSAHPSFH